MEAVAIVREELKRLSALVDEFLEFARPSPLEREVLIAQALCRRAAQAVEESAKKAGVDIELESPPGDLRIEADRGKVEQALRNLLENSIESLDTLGGGHIIVRAYRRGLDVVIEVEDNGPGVPAPDTPIFDAFYTTKEGGTGMGLAIVHRIVTDHGGSVGFESAPGRTVFWMALPAAVE
jgi:signal transduction histidine kinase